MSNTISGSQSTAQAQSCGAHLQAVGDAMDVLSGKWKIPIIGALRFGKRRFKELQREITGITAKMLSKELRDLEINQLVSRTVYDTKPVSVEYELTPYGKSLEKVILELATWGRNHRKRILQKK
jgi:DNA-binding HxlR family transcriptional regulator